MQKRLFIFIVLFLLFSSSSTCYAKELYKYKDANGHWVFSDRPPQKDLSFETFEYKQKNKPISKIELHNVKMKSGYTLYAKNNFYSPIEIAFTSPYTQVLIRKVIPARATEAILESTTKASNLNYQWALGDPNSVAQAYSYHAPFSSHKGHKITQAFNGQFSHNKEYNKYAVDIAMEIGTYLTAARAGTVVWVKDDYHMSGTSQYFLDKANVIKVLHDDGTFSSYAHVLMDTALVKEGDKIVLGQRLARSGSSGFSTGPHLHFSISKNSGLKNVTLPFTFLNAKGQPFTPKTGIKMVGVRL